MKQIEDKNEKQKKIESYWKYYITFDNNIFLKFEN